MSDLFNELQSIYSELTMSDFSPGDGTITLSDDGDGIQYISKWEYSQPIPEGFTLGKPSA